MEKKLEALEDEVIAVQSMFDGGTMAPLAIALALIDKGLIDANRLIEIIDTLHAILALDYELKLGSIEDAEIGLTRLRDFLDAGQFEPGKVLPMLRMLEASDNAASQLRQIAIAKKPKP
jgi:hypothetical protein